MCLLRPCYSARVGATLPLVKEWVNYACATIVFEPMHKLQIELYYPLD